jgi:hypothetical protein
VVDQVGGHPRSRANRAIWRPRGVSRTWTFISETRRSLIASEWWWECTDVGCLDVPKRVLALGKET